jgi:hypothetical protein
VTKKDGDKLRAMCRELREMADEYDPHGTTSISLWNCVDAISEALKGHTFRVVWAPDLVSMPPRAELIRQGWDQSTTEDR